MASKSNTDPMQADISALESKRLILQQIVDITKAMESMQDSLNAVLVLGVASKDMPEDALNLYSSLSDSLRNLPVNKIKLYFNNLESIIKSQLEKILHYSGLDYSSSDDIEFISLSSDEGADNPLDLLDEFKRTAQTAVSLRVLLRKRGVATAGSPIPVSPAVIKKQLAHLENQEQQQRAKVREKIQEMKADVEMMLENPNYPDAMKQVLKGVVANLEQDTKQLDNGASLSRLSFVAESEEMVNVEDLQPDVEEIQIGPIAEEHQNSSFSDAASRWLNSPWDVSWNDVAGDKKR